MRTTNIKIKLTIPIPYDKPDDNGCIYTKEAVENAVNNLHTKLPIFCGDTLIGVITNDSHITTWDIENQICNLTVDGITYYGGTECFPEFTDNKVTSMQIVGFGISKE